MRPRLSASSPAAGRFSASTLPGAADGVEQSIGDDAFLADEIRGHFSVGQFLDAFHFFIQAHGGAAVAHVVAERFHHFRVGEFQQARALFHDDHAHAQRGEHAGVLDADHAAADHDQRARQRAASRESDRY